MFKRNETDATRAQRSRAAAPARLHDKQSERDYRQLRIDKVGVRGLRFPIQVRDKARAIQNTVATIGIAQILLGRLDLKGMFSTIDSAGQARTGPSAERPTNLPAGSNARR